MTTVPKAIVILGVAALRNLALGLGITKVMSGAGKGKLIENFWDHSICTASACEVLARRTKKTAPEEAFLAGLLHDIGHLVFLTAVPKEFNEAVELGPANLVENEKKIIGMAHTRAGHNLMKLWKLPPIISDAVRFHHTPKVIVGKDVPLISLVALGDCFAGISGKVYERSLTEEDFRKLVKTTGFNIEEAKEIFEEIETRVNETKLFLQIATDGDLSSGDQKTYAAKKITVISTDTIVSEWSKQVLTYYGHELTPMKDFVANAETEQDIDLIILDSRSLNTEQLLEIKPILDKYINKLLILGSKHDCELASFFGPNPRFIPLSFSREDLELE